MSDYNHIYKKLVKGPNDVVGALAYALYKEEKIAYINQFTQEHQREPADEDLKAFHRMTNVEQRIQSYQDQAEKLLQNFLEDVLTTQLQEEQRKLTDSHAATAFKTITQAIAEKNGFWKGVGQNVVAGIVTTLITFGFVLGAWMWTEGPTKILSGAWHKYTQESPQTTP